MKTFVLYTGGTASPISFKEVDHERGGYPWRFRIRANSRKQATALYAKQVVSVDGGAGVFNVDHNDGSGAGWPWQLDINAVADWLQ